MDFCTGVAGREVLRTEVVPLTRFSWIILSSCRTFIFPEVLLMDPFFEDLDGIELGIERKGDLSLRGWVEDVRLLCDGWFPIAEDVDLVD